MKNIGMLLLGLVMVVSAVVQADKLGNEREAKQAELDAACEVARQKKIIVAKAEHVEECVEKKQRPDRAACERFYANYGERAGNQPPLYYDLPECEKADDYRRSPRSAGN